jgi:cytochrome b subunit of formate dehydrogenase
MAKVKNKAKVNYWVDIVIGLGFLVSAVSGIILWAVPMGGYQGGRNPFYGREVLFLDNDAWRALHTWGSIAMVAGVLIHLVLHWNWMVCMTRNMVRGMKASRAAKACELGDNPQLVGATSSPKLQTR